MSYSTFFVQTRDRELGKPGPGISSRERDFDSGRDGTPFLVPIPTRAHHYRFTLRFHQLEFGFNFVGSLPFVGFLLDIDHDLDYVGPQAFTDQLRFHHNGPGSIVAVVQLWEASGGVVGHSRD